MERNAMAAPARRILAVPASALLAATALACGPAQALVVMHYPPGQADYAACSEGQAWLDSAGARFRAQADRQRNLSPPRDPRLRETVLRLAAQARVSAQDQAADAADWAAMAADAAADTAADTAADAGSASPTPAAIPRDPVRDAARERLREILLRQPMPGAAEIGLDGAEALWDALSVDTGDPRLQERLIEAFLQTQLRTPGLPSFVLREAMEQLDRLRVEQGRPQRYGTQFEEASGHVQRLPVQDEALMRAHRAEFGLMPSRLETCLRQVLRRPYGPLEFP